MIYATQDIIDTLKGARAAKGLSQRALSKRTGIPQSHISKIESGGTDIRLSSLTELARALDLDLKLVPRKAVPVVDSLVRSTVPTVSATPAIRELNRTLEAIRNLSAVYPDLSELKQLRDGCHALKTLRDVGQELGALRDIGKRIRGLQQTGSNFAKWGSPTEHSKATHHEANIPAEHLQALRGAASAVQNLRNRLVHTQPWQPSPPRPAYRLDDVGEDEVG